jgi:hypothetical protein
MMDRTIQFRITCDFSYCRATETSSLFYGNDYSPWRKGVTAGQVHSDRVYDVQSQEWGTDEIPCRYLFMRNEKRLFAMLKRFVHLRSTTNQDLPVLNMTAFYGKSL